MLRVIVVGLGPIGVACARSAIQDAHMRLAGLVDADPDKIGMSLDEFGEAFQQVDEDQEQETGDIQVHGSVAEALAASGQKADVAILTTTSRFDRAARTIRDLLAQGLHVVSSCEEMVWPRYRHAALADEVDAAARAAGKVVLGAGVNPGFVMDFLAVTLATMVRRITAVRCVRRVNAGLRRVPLQVKVGATLKPDDFAALARANKIGHQGLAESIAMLGAGLGRTVAPGSVQVTLEPVLATEPTPSALGLVQPGYVAGIHNVGKWSCDDLALELDLTMAVGLADPKDVIEISGPVPLRLKIGGAVPGDSATVAALMNYARVLPHSPPGLRTMLDLPPAGCTARGA